MKRSVFVVGGTLFAVSAFALFMSAELPDPLMDMMGLCFPFMFGHTLWIQSSIGYNVPPGRKTNIFFGWGHHLPVHDPICSLGKQWVKEYTVHEPDGNVVHDTIDGEKNGGFVSIPYVCKKEGTYRLTSHIPTGYYTIYQTKNGEWHHFTEPLDTMEHPDQVEKILISLRYWEWTKAIMNIGTPDGNALKPVGQEMEIMLDTCGKSIWSPIPRNRNIVRLAG